MSVYVCDECDNSFCEDCNPSSECNFCSKAVCPDCEEKTLKTDARHRAICDTCLDRLPPVEKNRFKKSEGDKFNPLQKVEGKKGSMDDLLGALTSIGEDNG